MRKYNRSDKGKATDKRYKSRPEVKEHKRDLNRKYYFEHIERARSWSRITRAVKKGKIIRATACQKCSRSSGRLYAFVLRGKLPDHFTESDIRWLCPPCHRRRTNAVKERRERTIHDKSHDEWRRIHAENVQKIDAEQKWLRERFASIAHLGGEDRAREERRINVEFFYHECPDRADIAERVLIREGWYGGPLVR